MTQSGDDVEITRMSLRTGGWIGYTGDAVYIERDSEKIQIGNEHVREIALRSVQWDVAIMSALLVGVGATSSRPGTRSWVSRSRPSGV